jgi:hypothetical protein
MAINKKLSQAKRLRFIIPVTQEVGIRSILVQSYPRQKVRELPSQQISWV